jgi:DNA-binding LacI/PurR family transcriptional regulator
MLVVTPVFQPRGSKTFHSFQRRIGELQVRHLMQAGHRRLGFALPDDDRLLAFTTPRHEGATRACTELELPKPAGMTVPLDATAASDAVQRWMAEEPRITARLRLQRRGRSRGSRGDENQVIQRQTT